MSKYDTMTDAEIDKRIDDAFGDGYRLCLKDNFALDVAFGDAQEEGKDATTRKK